MVIRSRVNDSRSFGSRSDGSAHTVHPGARSWRAASSRTAPTWRIVPLGSVQDHPAGPCPIQTTARRSTRNRRPNRLGRRPVVLSAAHLRPNGQAVPTRLLASASLRESNEPGLLSWVRWRCAARAAVSRQEDRGTAGCGHFGDLQLARTRREPNCRSG